MMAALYNRLQEPGLHQPRDKRPDRTRSIQKYLFEEFEIPGLPKWGATAIRGDLMDNKEHIRRFIDHVNELPSDKLEEAWEACGKAYKEKMEKQRSHIELNSSQSLITVINDLIEEESVGQVQQPLCYAAVNTLHEGTAYAVETKRVYAGDEQSGELGDVRVLDTTNDRKPLAVYEVKAHTVDAQKVRDVLEDHEDHDYVLNIVAKGFGDDVEHRENLTLLPISGFVQTVANMSAVMDRMTLEEAAEKILQTYNGVMFEIEDRPEYAVDLEEVTDSNSKTTQS